MKIANHLVNQNVLFNEFLVAGDVTNDDNTKTPEFKDEYRIIMPLNSFLAAFTSLTFCTTSNSLARPEIPKLFNEGVTARQIVLSVLSASATTRFVVSGSRFLSTHSTEA